MGDAGQSHHHGFQPQLLSFGGVGAQHHVHQFAAQAPAAASRSRGGAAGGAGGEIVPATPASHSRVRGGGGGEIVAVQGGHIVRSTGRKDRHSKVCTARGPRDRRVRLSAHTAIQFYDVQDRLGYDRPSKAVDWLIKNAKDAIDKLEVLPAWQPTAGGANAAAAAPPSSSTQHAADSAENSDDQAQAITVAHTSFEFPGSGGTGGGAGFLPASLDSDSIADTIKSFFPMAGTAGGEASSSTAAAQSSAMGFQSYTPDLLSRTGSHSQELRLSLQSLPDPMSFHQQDRSQHGHGGNGSAQQALFPGYSFGGGAMWGEQAQGGGGQRMVPWNLPDPGGGSTGGGGYLFNVSQQAAHMQAALAGQSQQFLFQRGPLQSSNQPSDRGWPETVEADNNPMQQHHQGIMFAPGVGFPGFRIPTRIQGDEDHNGGGGNGDKPPPSSVSSASHH
ncbi:unnamed protein product [Urochloa decumbens]|uniref:TCP domain-containing protein n=1 Tax=Urochloa decumbens TaxID=240449 RepID=A0ABC8ZSC9_9POAL